MTPARWVPASCDWVITTLFPQLPPRERPVFGVGLVLVVAAAVGAALLGWQLPVIVIAVLGLPVLFAVYLWRIDFRRVVRGRYLALAAVAAVGLGAGWQLLTGPLVEDAYYAEMGGQLTAGQLLVCGVAIPITYAFVLVAPAALVRAVDRAGPVPLDGFTIGAVGATVVNAASTATYLVPQLQMGLAGRPPVTSLLIQAMVEGAAWPLGSMAAGGIFGLALWFVPKDGAFRRHRRAFAASVGLLAAIGFAVLMGFVDVAPIPMGVYVALQLPIMLAALLTARAAIAGAVRNGATLRHPQPNRPRSASYRAVLGTIGAALGVPVAAAVLVALLLKPAPAAYVCPPDCGRPPLGSPVETNPRFSGDDGVFSVAYPGEGTAYEVLFDPPGMTGVQARYTGGDTGLLNLYGEPARDRTPKQIVEDVLRSKFAGATVAYEIPNASVGYQPGYGVVADLYLRDARLRVIVMAAVKYDYALIATAAGPYHEFSPEYGTGHPSGANLEVAMDMGKYVNSFRWNADRYERSS